MSSSHKLEIYKHRPKLHTQVTKNKTFFYFWQLLHLASLSKSMSPLLNDGQSIKQVHFDTHNFGASPMGTTTIHQQDLDRCQEQKSPADSIRVVSPGGQSNSKHRHYQVPTARSSSTKSVIKLPSGTSIHPIPSSNRLKDYRRSKNGMAGMPSMNNAMRPPKSILKNPKRSPRPTSLAETIVCATAGLLSLRPSLAPNTPASKKTTNTVTWSDMKTIPHPLCTSISVGGTEAGGLPPVSILPSSSCFTSQSSSRKRTLALRSEKENTTTALSSDWDAMFFNHVVKPVEDRSTLPADLDAGLVWLDQQRLLHAAFKNGQIHFADTFQEVQASSRLNLLEMMGMKM
jgi:hypothetical protein